MADTLHPAGKNAAMDGIKSEIQGIILYNSAGTNLSSETVTASDFTVETDGTLKNSTAIDFSIGSGAVGETATYVTLVGSAESPGDTPPLELITIDLDATVTLTTEGTATFAIGDLTADL